MKFVIILFVILVAALLTAVSIGYWIERPITVTTPVQITIAQGDRTPEIGAKLDSAGLINSARVFRWMARWRKIDRHLRPGRYKFEGQLSITDILDTLSVGRAMTVDVTIPEGWTIARIVPYLAGELGFPSDSLRALMDEPALLAEIAPGVTSLEGYLWPETYQFFWGVDPRSVVNELTRVSKQFFTDSLGARARQLGLSRHQVLTLASMIEAEAVDGEERGIISGVFHNRLRDGWLLQCDPTVVYALGGLPPERSLLKTDLDFDSPYNTYLYRGLPPGPINNPGKASILAALDPDPTGAMYFVANGDGSHTFSRTLSQHNSASAKIKRELRKR